MLSTPAMAGIGAAGGFAGADMLGNVMDVFDAPRRGMWSALGLPTKGNEAVGQIMNMDPNSPLIQALGAGAEMLFDPINLMGGFLGKVAGKSVGAAANRVRQMQEAKKGLSAELKAVDFAGSKAMTGLKDLDRYDYIAEALPQSNPLGLKTYRRVDPEVANKIEQMGIGYPIHGQGMAVVEKPSFATGKGGVLKHADLSSQPATQMTLSPAGVEKQGQLKRLMRQAQPEDEPLLKQLLAPEDVSYLQSHGFNTEQMLNPAWRQALDRSYQIRGQLDDIASEPLSILEKMLMRYGG